MANLLTNLTRRIFAAGMLQVSKFHSMTPAITNGGTAEMGAGGVWSFLSTRTKVRCYFPKPRETKRINVHGWAKRMSTPGGRRVLMRRILKGRHVLSH